MLSKAIQALLRTRKLQILSISMRFHVIFLFLFSLLSLQFCDSSRRNPEPHAQKIIQHILGTQERLHRRFCQRKKCIFTTFWDFDGTILKGDVTNGLPTQAGTLRYTGLQRRAIEQGYSNRFSDYADYMAAYHKVEKASGHAGAYRFLAAPFAGQSRRALEAFSRREFERDIRPYLFASSMAVFRALQDKHIRTYIISASADFFVIGTKDTLRNPREYMHGFETESVGDRLTGKIVEPFNYAEGKTARIKGILKKIKEKNPQSRVFVLAGFGNSYHTDGHFLKWISAQSLPAGKTISVMVNEEVPASEKSLFWLVKQEHTISGL